MRALTAAIVAELFPATKIARQALVGNTFSAQAPAVIDQRFSRHRDTLVKMAVNSHFDRGLCDCPGAFLYF
jgi:hypothetical protein